MAHRMQFQYLHFERKNLLREFIKSYASAMLVCFCTSLKNGVRIYTLIKVTQISLYTQVYIIDDNPVHNGYNYYEKEMFDTMSRLRLAVNKKLQKNQNIIYTHREFFLSLQLAATGGYCRTDCFHWKSDWRDSDTIYEEVRAEVEAKFFYYTSTR